MQTASQTPEPDLLDQPNPEAQRDAKRAAHFRNADYYAKRIPTLAGDNKRAAIRATLDHLKAALRA